MKDIETYKTYGKEWENELLKIPKKIIKTGQFLKT
jgi:hypothetical protein